MTETEAAVVQGAVKWVAAKEAMLAADEQHRGITAAERDMDNAEQELTQAVYQLLGRGPARREAKGEGPVR
jgi:hypothetical protein